MSDIDFNEITAEAPLSDVRKDRIGIIRPNRRPPSSVRPRPGSENDVIDSGAGVSRGTDADNPVEEDDQPALVSPKRVIPPRNAMQTNHLMALKSALQNRAKSEPNAVEPEEEPAGIKADFSQSLGKTELPAVSNPIKMPVLMSELKRNIKERPKTMDFGDINMDRNWASTKTKSPASPVSNILETEGVAAEESIKDVRTKEDVAAPGKQVASITRESESPKVSVTSVPTTAALPTITSKGQPQMVEKRQLRETNIQKTSEEVGQGFNVVPEKSISSKCQAAELVSKEVVKKSVTTTFDEKTINVERTGQNINAQKTQIKNEPVKVTPSITSSETSVRTTATVDEQKKFTAQSNRSTYQKSHIQSVETKTLISEQNKLESAKVTPVSKKSNEVIKSEGLGIKDNIQLITTPGKASDQVSIKHGPKTTNKTAKDEIIKNTADNISGIKSTNPYVTNSSRTIIHEKISDKSQPLDKIVNTASGNLNAIVDNEVREVTNDLLEKKGRIFKERQSRLPEVTKTSIGSSPSKNTTSVHNMNANSEAEVANVTNQKKQGGTKETKAGTKLNTSPINVPQNKEKQMDLVKKSDDIKEVAKLITNPKNSSGFMQSNIKLDKVSSQRSDSNLQSLGSNSGIQSTPKIESNIFKHSKDRKTENENISMTAKVEKQDDETEHKKKLPDLSSVKSMAQVTKRAVITSQSSSPPSEVVSTFETAQEPISTKNNVTKSVSNESKLKNRSSWIKDLAKDNNYGLETNSKATEGSTQTKEGDVKNTKVAATQNIGRYAFNKSYSYDSIVSSDDTKVKEEAKTKDTSEAPNETSGSLGETSRIQTKSYGKSSPKESVHVAVESFTSASRKKEEVAKSTSSTAQINISQSKTDAIVNNFRVRNNLAGNISKSSSNENLSSNKDKILPDMIKAPELTKGTNENSNSGTSSSKNLKNTETEPKVGERNAEMDPFGANRRNNIFRKLSSAEKAPKETVEPEQKVINKESSKTDVKMTSGDKDSGLNNIRSRWRLPTSITSPNSERENKSNTDPVTMSQSSEVIKDTKISSTDVNQSRTVNLLGAAKGAAKISSDALIKDSPAQVSAFARSTKGSMFNVLGSFEGKKEATANTAEGVEDKVVNLASVTTSSSDTTLRDNATKALTFQSSTRTRNDSLSRPYEAKKDSSSTDANSDKSVKPGGDKSSSPDTITKDNTLNLSAFAKPTNYKDLLKRSINKLSSPDKEEIKTQPASKISDDKDEKVVTQNVPAVKNVSSAESKWKRPVTLLLQKEEPRVSGEKPISPAATFLQGNKISKSILEIRKDLSSASNSNLKSTPTGSLTSLTEAESSLKPTTSTPTKPIEISSPSTPPKLNVSPATRHESPTFNKMFLPKATFRSPTSIINKSTEDISVAARHTNSFRKNRPQSLIGNEHVTITRTVSAAPIVESTAKESSGSGAAGFLQEWKNKRRVNS